MKQSAHGAEWSDLWLERAALRELPDEEQARCDRLCQDDPALRARLEELSRSNAAILAEYGATEVAAEVARRCRLAEAQADHARAQQKRPSVGWGISAAVMAAACGVFMVLPLSEPQGEQAVAPAAEVTRLKGTPQLLIHRLGEGGALELQRGETVKAGDFLQLSYRAAQARFGVIISKDGRGGVTVHFPDSAMASELAAQGVASLDHSYELDDAPEYEVFFFVTSPERFAVEPVVGAVRALPGDAIMRESPRLALPAELTQVVFLLRKADR